MQRQSRVKRTLNRGKMDNLAAGSMTPLMFNLDKNVQSPFKCTLIKYLSFNNGIVVTSQSKGHGILIPEVKNSSALYSTWYAIFG